MKPQEMLHEAYQELAEKGNWESQSWKLVLTKGGLIIKSKLSDKQVELVVKL